MAVHSFHHVFASSPTILFVVEATNLRVERKKKNIVSKVLGGPTWLWSRPIRVQPSANLWRSIRHMQHLLRVFIVSLDEWRSWGNVEAIKSCKKYFQNIKSWTLSPTHIAANGNLDKWNIYFHRKDHDRVNFSKILWRKAKERTVKILFIVSWGRRRILIITDEWIWYQTHGWVRKIFHPALESFRVWLEVYCSRENDSKSSTIFI